MGFAIYEHESNRDEDRAYDEAAQDELDNRCEMRKKFRILLVRTMEGLDRLDEQAIDALGESNEAALIDGLRLQAIAELKTAIKTLEAL